MKKFNKLINIIVCVILIAGMYKINDLQNQIDNLRNNINTVDMNLRNDMNNIYDNVNNLLEEESNQLTTNNWEYDSIDIENKTARISCIILPKEYNPNVTKVKISNDNQEYSFDYVDGKYITKIDIPLFETTEFNQVELEDNGTIRTQEIKWSINPRYEALIQTFVNFTGSSRGSVGKDEYVWMPNGSINFNIEKKGTFDIKKIELVEMIDEKEINRYQVDITSIGQKKYAEELASKGESVPENSGSESSSSSYDGNATFIYPLKKEVKIPNGSEFVLYVDITDENDLIHRSYIEYIPLNEEGRIVEEKLKEFDIYRFSETHMILDKNGEILFQVDYD